MYLNVFLIKIKNETRASKYETNTYVYISTLPFCIKISTITLQLKFKTMKALIPILLFTLFIVFLSCDTDEIVPQEDSVTSSDLTITTTQTETVENNNARASFGATAPITPEAVALEHTLQWISFTTSNLIFSNTLAKEQFLERINYNILTNYSDSTIYIEDLIGPNIPDTDPFKLAFRERLIEIVSQSYVNEGCPLGPTEAPEPPLDTGNGGNGSPIMPGHFEQLRTSTPTPLEIAIMVDGFLAHIIADECIEIYLPIGMTPTFTEITSSAHPMTPETANNGYRMYAFQPCTPGEINTATENQTVNEEYASAANGPIIIARPTRSMGCEYSNYTFDFTDFLN